MGFPVREERSSGASAVSPFSPGALSFLKKGNKQFAHKGTKNGKFAYVLSMLRKKTI